MTEPIYPEKARVKHTTPIHETWSSIRRVGWYASLQLACSRLVDLLFDLYYGYDTRQRQELDELAIESENLDYASPYQPTGVLACRRILKQARLPEPTVIVDFGCGKGRVLILAARRGAQRITGIEFAPELCQTARKNLSLLIKQRPRLREICEVVCCDVTNYRYKGDENVFYFFFSFTEEVMIKVIKAIEFSLTKAPREALIIDFNPFSVIRQSSLFKLEESIDIYGYQCKFYRYKP